MLHHTNCSLDWKSWRDDKRNESQSSKFYRQKSSWLKPLSCKYMLPVLKRKDCVVFGPESPESEAVSQSPWNLRMIASNRVCLEALRNCFMDGNWCFTNYGILHLFTVNFLPWASLLCTVTTAWRRQTVGQRGIEKLGVLVEIKKCIYGD